MFFVQRALIQRKIEKSQATISSSDLLSYAKADVKLATLILRLQYRAQLTYENKAEIINTHYKNKTFFTQVALPLLLTPFNANPYANSPSQNETYPVFNAFNEKGFTPKLGPLRRFWAWITGKSKQPSSALCFLYDKVVGSEAQQTIISHIKAGKIIAAERDNAEINENDRYQDLRDAIAEAEAAPPAGAPAAPADSASTTPPAPPADDGETAGLSEGEASGEEAAETKEKRPKSPSPDEAFNDLTRDDAPAEDPMPSIRTALDTAKAARQEIEKPQKKRKGAKSVDTGVHETTISTFAELARKNPCDETFTLLQEVDAQKALGRDHVIEVYAAWICQEGDATNKLKEMLRTPPQQNQGAQPSRRTFGSRFRRAPKQPEKLNISAYDIAMHSEAAANAILRDATLTSRIEKARLDNLSRQYESVREATTIREHIKEGSASITEQDCRNVFSKEEYSGLGTSLLEAVATDFGVQHNAELVVTILEHSTDDEETQTLTQDSFDRIASASFLNDPTAEDVLDIYLDSVKWLAAQSDQNLFNLLKSCADESAALFQKMNMSLDGKKRSLLDLAIKDLQIAKETLLSESLLDTLKHDEIVAILTHHGKPLLNDILTSSPADKKMVPVGAVMKAAVIIAENDSDTLESKNAHLMDLARPIITKCNLSLTTVDPDEKTAAARAIQDFFKHFSEKEIAALLVNDKSEENREFDNNLRYLLNIAYDQHQLVHITYNEVKGSRKRTKAINADKASHIYAQTQMINGNNRIMHREKEQEAVVKLADEEKYLQTRIKAFAEQAGRSKNAALTLLQQYNVQEMLGDENIAMIYAEWLRQENPGAVHSVVTGLQDQAKLDRKNGSFASMFFREVKKGIAGAAAQEEKSQNRLKSVYELASETPAAANIILQNEALANLMSFEELCALEEKLPTLPKEPYTTLGLTITDNPSTTEIRSAYRKQSALKHPDKNTAAADPKAEFEAVKAAFETLFEPRKIRETLAKLKQEKPKQGAVAKAADRAAASFQGAFFGSPKNGDRRGALTEADIDAILKATKGAKAKPDTFNHFSDLRKEKAPPVGRAAAAVRGAFGRGK